ncbi:MAG: hypothetical protein ACK50C_03390, partial [Gemmatimonadaceae bacterium]
PRDPAACFRCSSGMATKFSLNPLTWFRRVENAIFAVAAEVEYRLKLAPRGTKIVPSDFDRRMIRMFLVVMPLLIGSLFLDDRALRIRLLLLAFAVVLFTVGLIFVLDARSANYTGRGRPPVARNRPAKPPAPSPRTPTTHWTRRK